MFEGKELQKFLKEFQNQQPTPQTRQFRDCLFDCSVAYELLFTLNQPLPQKSTFQDDGYITDLDLVDYCISDDEHLLKLWLVQQLQMVTSETNIITSSKLRTVNEVEWITSNAVTSLQLGKYQEAINQLEGNQQTEWLGHVLKSLAPLQDENIKPKDSKLLLLEFMKLPAFGNGNPHWLLTLQSLVQIRNKVKNPIIEWIFSRQDNSKTNGVNWQINLLNDLKQNLNYHVLNSFLKHKNELQDLLYFGYNQDYSLNIGDQQNKYDKIFSNITNQDPYVQVDQFIKDYLDRQTKNSDEKFVGPLSNGGRIIQLEILAQSFRLFTPQQILQDIIKIICVVEQMENEELNNRLRIRCLYEWANLSRMIDQSAAQEILRLSTERIIIQCKPGQKQPDIYNEGLELTLRLLTYINDYEFVSSSLNELISLSQSTGALIDRISNLNFSSQIKLKLVQKILEQMEYDEGKLRLIIQTINGMELQKEQKLESIVQLIRRLLERNLPKPRSQKKPHKLTNNILKLVFDEIKKFPDLGKYQEEISRYRDIWHMYNGMKQARQDQIENKCLQLVRDLQTTDVDCPAFFLIRAIWSFKLLKIYIRQRGSRSQKGFEDKREIYNFFEYLQENDFLKNIYNLPILMQLIPLELEEEIDFMKYILS